MSDDTVVALRQGARKHLAQAVEAEVADFLVTATQRFVAVTRKPGNRVCSESQVVFKLASP
ncbi:MAG: hypothetical protein ACR2RE_20655 [Geminicoccaceae bacterium]